MTAVAYNTIEHRTGVFRVRGKWCAFHDAGAWRPIRAEFVDEGGAFVFRQGPFAFEAPPLATGTATLYITNEWDIFGNARISSPVMPFEVTPQNVRPVSGRIDERNPSQVWYDDAWGPGLSLRYTVWHGRAPRSTREAVIDPQRCPRGRDLQASWLVRSPRAVTLIGGKRPVNPDGSEWTGSPGDSADIPVGGAAVHYADSNGLDPRRGAGFRTPHIWYWRDIDPATGRGTLVSQPAQVTALIVAPDTIQLTKTIPADLIDAAAAEGSLLITDDVQTIYPDPHLEVTTWDGYAGAFGSGYAPKADAAGHGGDTDGSILIGGNHFGGAMFARGFLLFDLSAVSDPITTVDISVSINTGGVAAYPAVYRLTQATCASDTGYTLSDFQNTYNNHDTTLGEVTDADDPGHNRRTGTLNATGLAYVQGQAGSICRFSFRGEADSVAGTGSAPTNSSVLSAETAGTDDDPYLAVTTAAAQAPKRSGCLSIGPQLRL